MKDPRLEPDSPAHGVISYDARIAADTDVSASSYASTVSSMPVESLEVHDQPAKAPAPAPMTDKRFRAPFSRRKAAVVSSIITVLVVILTGGTLAVLSREEKRPDASSRLNLNSQDVQLKNQSGATAPAELQGVGNAVLINGDLITRGELKVTNGAYVTVLRSANLTSNRNLTLPNASGTLCVDSNNCGYATTAQLQDLQSRLGQIVVPVVPDATTVNGAGGAVSVQGTSNQISVTTVNGVIALSTPQDIAPISSPTFAGLVLNGNFSLSGTVTLPLNCSGMLNGGALTTNASGQIICSGDDASGGGGSSVTTPGGTAGRLALFTAADTIADSIISEALGAITIGGNTTVSGALSASSLTLATALSVANGGTGATTFTTNGVLVGNGAGAITSTAAPTAGQVLLGDGSGVPQFTTVSGDVVITAAGVTAIQADSVALGVDTTGGYVASLGALTGLATSGNSGEGSTPTLSVVYGSTANTSVQGNTSITVGAGTNLTGGGSITLGGGGTVTLNVTNSPVFSGNVIAQGGAVTIGTTSRIGNLVLHDGNGQIGTLATTDLTSGQTYTFPDATGTVCLSTGNCVGGSGGAPNGATYLTIGNDATLNNERSITAGDNISFTDGGANGTFTIGTVNNPNFSTSVTTPLLQSSGALSISVGGALTVGTTTQTALLQGSTTTITSNGVGNDIVLTSADQIRFTGFNCTTYANGGVLTTDASGNITCADDDGGAGGAITGTGTSGTIPVFTGASTLADSVITQAATTINIAGTLTLDNALAVADGGTGVTSFTANGVVFGNGSGALQVTAAGTSGQLLVANGSGVPTFVSMSGDVVLTSTGTATIQADSVAMGVDTTGDFVASLGALTGLTTSGNTGEASTPTLAVIYGSTANTSVEGNTTITCTSGTGNLSGGGGSITLGAGGSCGSINTVNNPTFTTSVTTPLLQSSGALSITPGGALTVGATGQTALLQGSTTTITSSGVGGDIVLTTANNITLTGFNCTTNANGGVLTTDASGNIVCSDDDGGAVGAISGSGSSNRLALFSGAQTIADSWLLQNGSTLELDSTRNLSLLGGNFSVTGTGTFSGLLTANGGLTIESGDTFTMNGDAFTDLTGTGLVISSGSLQTTLGTSVDLASEITGTLGVTNGGTGLNGSAAANGQLLIGNGTGYTLATLTQGDGITITNGSGSITVANAFGATIELGVETTGNYQAGTVAGNGISVSGSAAAGWSPTVALGALTSNWNQTGAFDIVLNNANSQLRVLESAGGTFFGAIDVGDLTADRTYTFPDASGTVCLSTGNCAGAGGGITGSGTADTIAKFTGAGTIGDSSISDDGSVVTLNGTANLVIQGGTATFGTTTQAGTLTISDGSSNTVSIVASAFAANQTYTLPDVGGAATFCMSTGNCVGGGAGGAPNAAAYLVASLDGTLTNERALNAGSNISLTDGGAGGNFTVATVQNPTFTASVTTPQLQSSGALTLVSAAGEIIAVDAGTTIELQDSTNVTGSLGVSIALNVGTGNAFQVNSSGAIAAATGITSSGTVTFSALNCTTFTNGGKVTANGSGQLTCANDTGAAANTITGTGTNGTLPMFTASNVIADSVVTQSGTTVSIAGDLTLSTALSVANGGTGAVSFTANGLLYGNGTGALQATVAGTSGQVLVANGSGVPTFVSFSGDVTVAANGATTIQPDSVALGTDTTGDFVANLGTLTGLSTSGNTGEASTPTLSVNYGSTANTAVQGNTQLTCPSGTGNLSGGGTVITLGTGGTCGNLDTVANPTFSTSVTTPILQSTGTLTITPGGALTIGATNQTFALQGNATSTITATGGDGFVTTVGFSGVATGAVTYQFDRTATPGTYTICTDAGNCGTTTGTLQNAYTYSVGGATPEIKLDGTRNGIDIQDADTTLGAGQNFMSFRAPNASGLGNLLVGFGLQGNLFMQAGTDRTDYWDINDQAGNNLFTLDSSNKRVGINLGGTNLPGYTLDVTGSANVTSYLLVPVVDTASAVTLNLGTTNASAITIGKAGVITTVNGGLTVAANQSITLADGSGAIYLDSDNSVYIGEKGSTDTDVLQMSARVGYEFLIDGSNLVLDVSQNGMTTVRAAADNFGGLEVLQSNGNHVLRVLTSGTEGEIRVGYASDTEATLFILDNDKDETSDPTGVEGAMYYNNGLNKFRCYQNTGWVDCISPTGASTTLQQAYDFSSNPEIVLDGTRGALTVRDNASPLGARLLEVQSNDGSVTYFGVASTGLTVNTALSAGAGGTGNSLTSTISTTSGMVTGNRIDTVVNPASNSSADIIGTSNTISTSGTSNFSGDLIASLGQINWAGTGTSSDRLMGSVGKVVASVGSGAVQTAVGVMAEGQFEGGAVTNYYGLYSTMNSLNNVAIQNAYGLKIDNFAAIGSAAPTNFYAIAADGGMVRFTGNSAYQFQIQNAALTPVFNVDTTTTNLITNPSIEVDTTGWISGGGATISKSAAITPYDANFALRIDTTAAVGDGARFSYGLSGSTQYTLSFFAKAAAGNGFGTLQAGRSDDGGTDTACTLSPDPSGFGAGVNDTYWKRYTCTFTTGAISGSPYIYIKQTDATARSFYIDAIQLETSASATMYRAAKTAIGGTLVVNGGQPEAGTTEATLKVNVLAGGHGLIIRASGANDLFKSLLDVRNADNTVSYLNINEVTRGTSIRGGNSAFSAAALEVVSIQDAAVALSVKGAAGQTANILQVANDGGTNLFTVGPTGAVTIGATSQQGSLILHDGNGQTATISVGSGLAANAALAIPTGVGASDTFCLQTLGNCGGGGPVTLQSAYNNSTNPEIVLDSTRGALTIRDNGTPISGNLFEVQNNGGGTTYLGLTSAALTLGSGVDVLLTGANAYISNPQAQTASEAFGLNAVVNGPNSVAVGNGANTHLSGNSVAIGASAFGGVNGTAIGNGASAQGNGVVIGNGSFANSASTALGEGSSASAANSIALGRGATTTASNQLVIGGDSPNYISQVVIGNSVTNGAPIGFTLQGTSGSGSNIAGAAVNIAGGQGTGSAAGGAINLQVSASGASGTSLNSLATVATFSSTSVTLGHTTNTTAINLQSAGTTMVTSSATAVPVMEIQQTANSTASGHGLLVRGGTNPGATAFEVRNSGNTPIFSVDTSNSRTSIGSGTSCTGRLCVGQSSSGSVGSATTTNLYNIQNINITTSGTPTYIGQNIVMNDTSSAQNTTLRPLTLDTTGSTNTSATINSIQALIPSNANGTFLQFQNGATDVLNINNTGATTLRLTSNSANAFRIQNATGGSVFNLDTTPVSTNLVANGSFETDTAGWTARTGTANMVRTTTHPLFGVAGMSFDTNASGEGVNYPVQLSPSTQYVITFYSKNLTSTTSSFVAGYAEDGSTETTHLSGSLVSSTSGWNKYEYSFTTGGTVSGSAYLFIKTTSSSTRTFAIDGVQIVLGQYGAYRESTLSLHGTVINTPLQVQTDNNTETALSIISSEGYEVFNVNTTEKTVSVNTSSFDARFNVNTNGSMDAIRVTNSGTGAMLRLIDTNGSSADVFTVADEGATTITTKTNTASAFQVQNAGAADTMFSVNTTTRTSGVAGNAVKIGNSTGTDTDLTILQLDSTSADPTTNLASMNGGLFYNSLTGKVNIIEGGQVKVLCNMTDMGCGAGATTTLQDAYDDGATILMTDARDLVITSPDTATDSSIIFNLQCTSCSANGGRFAVQNAGTDVFQVNPNGSIRLGTATDNMTFNATFNGRLFNGNARPTRQIKLVPEFPGSVFSADGSNNQGFMQTDFVTGLSSGQGNKHNYYEWTTDQGTAQDYDIKVLYQLPSDFDGFASGSFKIWTYIDSATSTDIEVMIADDDNTQCYASLQSAKPGSTGTWTQTTLTDPGNGCTFAANDVITITIRPTAISPQADAVRLGEFQFDYLSKF